MKTPKPIPSGTPVAFATSDVDDAVWPIITTDPQKFEVNYKATDGTDVGTRTGRQFLATRNSGLRWHVGLDLFGRDGDKVVACEDGKIVSYYGFYMTSAGEQSYALFIEHEDFVINYGEVKPGAQGEFGWKVGDMVKAGDVVARVSTTNMIHFETYRRGTGSNQRWMVGGTRPPDLLNPTLYLLNLAASAQAIAGPLVGGITPPPVAGAVLKHPLLAGNLQLQLIAAGAASPLVRGRDSGEPVGILQDALDALGVPRFRVNAGSSRGTFGPATENAVTEFQKAAGIVQDGKAGKDTLIALDAALAKPKGPAVTPGPKTPSTPPLVAGAVLGSDSNALVNGSSAWKGTTKTLVAWSNQALGANPHFWGRYFKGPGDTSNEQYQGKKENNFLNGLGIRVLAIGRQTTEVGGSEAVGKAAGRRNTDALFEAFPSAHLAANGKEFLFFLDVEPTHPMSTEYYTGWANEVIARSQSLSGGKVTILPAVYVNYGDKTTYKNLKNAMTAGVQCLGLWVARYLSNTATGAPKVPAWNPAKVEHPDAPTRVLIWQYAGDCYGASGSGPLDFNVANPAFQSECLSLLIPTPV